MFANVASPGETPTAPASFSKEFRVLWFRATRNLVVGSLISVLSAFIFYSVVFSYTPRQLRLVLGVVFSAALAALALDLGLNWLYLRPLGHLRLGQSDPKDAARVYARLHNFPLFSFVRVFRPHARRAVDAALEMEARLQELNKELAERGEPPLEIGIGIDSGEVIAGNVGARSRMEYTVIGNPVNQSSRIEQLNKGLGTRILVSARTWDRGNLKVGRAHPPVSVKGIDEPLKVFALGAKG